MTSFLQQFAPIPQEGMTLDATNVTFQGPLSLLWAGIVLVIVAAIHTSLNARRKSEIRWRNVAARILLRFFAFAVLLGLVTGPKLEAEYSGTTKRPIAIILDNSQSMQLEDARETAEDRSQLAVSWVCRNGPPRTTPSRAWLVQRALEDEQLALMNGLNGKGPIELYLCGDRLRALEVHRNEGAIRSLATHLDASDNRSAIADAVAEVVVRRGKGRPAAVVLFTDGTDNASQVRMEEVGSSCRRLGVPVHIFGVGAIGGKVLKLRPIGAPPIVLAKRDVPVTVQWDTNGFGTKEQAELVLRLGSDDVARRSVALSDGRVELTLPGYSLGVPVGGREKLTVSIRVLGEPPIQDVREKWLSVIDRRPAVLVVDRQARWEYRFINGLLRGRAAGGWGSVSFWLTDVDTDVSLNEQRLKSFPDRNQLFKYDAIIIGDLQPSTGTSESSKTLTSTQWTDLREYVREGGGLIVVAGRDHMPGNYSRDTILGGLLPVTYSPNTTSLLGGFSPRPTRPENQEPITRTPQNGTEWPDLPAIHWYFPSTPRPGAFVILEDPHPTGQVAAPILSQWSFGFGSVFFLSTDETWRWRYNDIGRQSYFWMQLIDRACQPHLLAPDGPVRRLETESTEFLVGNPGRVSARLLDKDLRPLTKAVTGRIQVPGEMLAASIILKPSTDQPGDFEGTLPTARPGRYRLTLDEFPEASIEYDVVVPRGSEKEPKPMSADLLRTLADRSGGRFYREEDLPTLVSLVLPQVDSAKVYRTIEIFHPAIPFALICILLTVEWLVRRFSNLS